MLSFHNEEHKARKLKYKSNLPIKEEKVSGEDLNDKEGYIRADELYYFNKNKIQRADELYYFNKNKIQYKVIAHMDPELLDELVQLILLLHDENKLKIVTFFKKDVYYNYSRRL